MSHFFESSETRRTQFNYTDSNNPYLVTNRVDPNGAITRYTYKSNSDLQTVEDPGGNITEFFYAEDVDVSPIPDKHRHLLRKIQRPTVTVREGTPNEDLEDYDPTELEVTPTKAVKWEYGYDWLDRLVTVSRAEAADVGSLGATTLQREYVFDESDNRVFFDDHVNDVTYHYVYATHDSGSGLVPSDVLEEILVSATAGDRTLPGDFVSLETFEHDEEANLIRRTISSTSEDIDYTWTEFNKKGTSSRTLPSLGSPTARHRQRLLLKIQQGIPSSNPLPVANSFLRRARSEPLTKPLEQVESSVHGRIQVNRFESEGLRERTLDKNNNSAVEYGVGISTSSSRPGSSTSTFPTISYIQGAGGILGFEKNGNFSYFLTDALSTVRDLVDDEGVVLASYEFDEYGQRLATNENGASSPKTFVGGLSVQDEVAETGLMLMGHRFYDPTLGRFLNRDPIGFAGGLNLFGYANGNPVRFVDAAGLKPILGPKARKILGPEYSQAFEQGIEQARRRWKLFGQEPFDAVPSGGTLDDIQSCRLPFDYEDYLNGPDDILFELAPESYFQGLGASDGAAMIADPDGKTIWIREKNALADPYDLGQKIIHEPTHSFLFREDVNYNLKPPGYAHPEQIFKYGVDAIPVDSSWR